MRVSPPRRLRWTAAVLLMWCVAATAADYVRLPGGRFESALPQGPIAERSLPVEIAPFEISRMPVTAGDYLAFVQSHPDWRRGETPALFADARYLADWAAPLQLARAEDAVHPVVNVSWFAARTYCESEGARLPTWLEWEYVAAADAERRDARSDPQWRARILAWYERPTGVLPAVGGLPNAYGVRDLHGVVWEWVDDFNALFIAGDSRTQGDPDLQKFCGAGAISVIDRDSYAVLMRVALLSSLGAADSTSSLGFRCARSIDAGGPP